MKIWKERNEKLKIWVHKADFTHKGKRYRPEAESKEDLATAIVHIKAEANRKKYGLESRSRITLELLLTEHLKEFDLTKKTHRRGKVVLNDFIETVGKSKNVEEVVISDIRTWIRKRKDESDLMPESVNKEVGYVSSMLQEAHTYFKQLDGYKPPRMPWATVPKNTTQRVIYKNESEQLLAHLRYPELHAKEKPTSRLARFEYADMFEIAYNTAMRWGEVHLIEWRMIDWRKNEIYLPSEITKTEAGRTVYLNSHAVEILKRRKEASESKYVFPGKTPDVPRKYYYEGIRRAAKAIGLPFGRDVGFTLHSSKHTAITDVLEATGDFAAAQAMGGHTSKTMTLKYTHTTTKRLHEAAEQLAKIRPPSTES